MPYSLTDTLIGPIATGIANVLKNDVGIQVVYEKSPNAAPENGSVLIPPPRFRLLKLNDEYSTNGKQVVQFRFSILLCYREANFGDGLLQVQNAMLAILLAFTAWRNQTLGGTCTCVSPVDGAPTKTTIAGTPFVCLIVNLDIEAEFNIDLTG